MGDIPGSKVSVVLLTPMVVIMPWESWDHAIWFQDRIIMVLSLWGLSDCMNRQNTLTEDYLNKDCQTHNLRSHTTQARLVTHHYFGIYTENTENAETISCLQ